MNLNGNTKLVTIILAIIVASMFAQGAVTITLWTQNRARIADIQREREHAADRLRVVAAGTCQLQSGQNYAVLAFLQRRNDPELASVRPLFPVLSREECAAQARRQIPE